MANIQGQKKWSDVRLLEKHELARGGVNGNLNEQAKALADRTEFLNQEKASKSEIVQGVFEFGTYAEFDAAKVTLPLHCTVVINEENNTGTGNWGIGNNRWDGITLTKSSFDPVELSKQFTKTMIQLDDAKYALVLTDPQGRFSLLIYPDGRIKTKYGDLTAVQKFVKDNQAKIEDLFQINVAQLSIIDQFSKNIGSDLFQFRVGDRVPVRVLKNGHIWNNGKDILKELERIENKIPSQLESKWITPNKNLVAVGDSLTAYVHEWFANLYKYLNDSDRTYVNYAVGGDTSVQQALKFGASNCLLTLENKKINAVGSTNITGTFVRFADKTIESITLLSSQSSKTITGNIAGIAGVINATYNGTTMTALTFTPTVTLSADVPVYDYTPFVPASLETDKFKTFAIAIGRNNLSQPDRIKQDIFAMINAQATIEKRFFVITPPPKAYSAPNRDSPEIMANIFDLERWAMENFGEQAIISRQILMRHGNGSETDNLDIANNCVPTSCTEDGLHWTATANTYIAQEVAKLINSKGW